MIISAGQRTDIAQYYTPWLLRRFEEGFVFVRNPLFPSKVTRYELDPAVVDCVIFCSKNYAPILPHLGEITSRFNTYFYYTITAYGPDMEPGVPDIDTSVDTLLALEGQVGARRICWRYDPVLLSGTYTIERHRETFEHLCKRLAGHVDRCVFSFVQLYSKLERNMPELATIGPRQREQLAQMLGEVAARHGIWLQTCVCEHDYSAYGIHPSGCATLEILGRANGVAFRDLAHKGIRENCHCFEMRDIGAYDTCPNGCRYCYATKNHERARANHALHNPSSPFLLGGFEPGDELTFADQRSYLKKGQPDQLSLGL